MANRCVYCKREIDDDRAVSVCDSCGKNVWGDKMFGAIKENMGNAKEKGDLFQGSVCNEVQKDLRNTKV